MNFSRKSTAMNIRPSSPALIKELSPRKHPHFFQLITWVVVMTQVLIPFQGAISAWAAEQSQPHLVSRGNDTDRDSDKPVSVNRTVPDVAPPSAQAVFSDSPTDAEFFRAGIFAEPLVAIGNATSSEENKALAKALQQFLARTENDDTSALVRFLEAHPQSAWRASVLLNLGGFYRKTGYFTKALATWKESWDLSQNDTTAHGMAVADLAVAEYLELNARLGRMDVLQPLLAQIEKRDVRGPATVKVLAAKEGLLMMEKRPGEAFKCGPFALHCILNATRAPIDSFDTIKKAQSSQ